MLLRSCFHTVHFTVLSDEAWATVHLPFSASHSHTMIRSQKDHKEHVPAPDPALTSASAPAFHPHPSASIGWPSKRGAMFFLFFFLFRFVSSFFCALAFIFHFRLEFTGRSGCEKRKWEWERTPHSTGITVCAKACIAVLQTLVPPLRGGTRV